MKAFDSETWASWQAFEEEEEDEVLSQGLEKLIPASTPKKENAFAGVVVVVVVAVVVADSVVFEVGIAGLAVGTRVVVVAAFLDATGVPKAVEDHPWDYPPC